jgi:hypothetical protein
MLITGERYLQLVLSEYADHYTPIGRTGPGAEPIRRAGRIRPPRRPTCAFCAGTGSAA